MDNAIRGYADMQRKAYNSKMFVKRIPLQVTADGSHTVSSSYYIVNVRVMCLSKLVFMVERKLYIA